MTQRQQAATEALAEACLEALPVLTFAGALPLYIRQAEAILAALPEGWTLTNHLYADLEAAAQNVIDRGSEIAPASAFDWLDRAVAALTESEEAS